MVGNRVICVSWEENLSITRQALLTHMGVRVVSAVGWEEGLDSCGALAQLMILGHSVPTDFKRRLIQCFREHSSAPILSLVRPGQEKLPEATFGVDSTRPDEFIEIVRNLLS